MHIHFEAHCDPWHVFCLKLLGQRFLLISVIVQGSGVFTAHFSISYHSLLSKAHPCDAHNKYMRPSQDAASSGMESSRVCAQITPHQQPLLWRDNVLAVCALTVGWPGLSSKTGSHEVILILLHLILRQWRNLHCLDLASFTGPR